MTFLTIIITNLLILLNVSLYAHGLHLTGTWKHDEFFKFLDRFGFQKTDMNDKENTQGFIYGNITSTNNVTLPITFVVVDSDYFIEFYENRTLVPKTNACPAMFKKIDTVAWDEKCRPNGTEDFLRKVPCPKGKLCKEEVLEPDKVVPGYQFTFRIQDIYQPRFWYISIAGCYHNDKEAPSCFWNYNEDKNLAVDYDIWLVNGNPFVKHYNPFEHQFSFEMHDVFEIHLVFLITYTVLVPIQLYALSQQKHLLPLILTTCMAMEYVGVIFNFIHVLKFAFDGVGVDMLRVSGNFIDMFAQCLVMLVLLLVVKGWTITRMNLKLRSKIFLFTVWGTYTAANLALFIWNLVEVDIISDIDEWQTWPGFLILAFRLCIMAWFLLELRDTVSMERKDEKRRFYLHFGAGFLVWFVYLPILAAISSRVSAHWRYKTVLSVTYSADFLSYAIMVHLLWPSRSYLYFNLKTDASVPLEDFEIAGLLVDDDDESSDELFDSSSITQRPLLSLHKPTVLGSPPLPPVPGQHKYNGHVPDSGIEVDNDINALMDENGVISLNPKDSDEE